jgi:hypothetical protein
MKVGLRDFTSNWPFEDKKEIFEQKKFHPFFFFALPCKSMAYTIWCNFHACIHLWKCRKQA